MVFWGSGQIDEYGWKVKGMVEEILQALGKRASDFLLILQDGNSSDPTFRLRTPFGERKCGVSLYLVCTMPEWELRAKLTERIQTMYGRPPAGWLAAKARTRRFHRLT